MLVDAFDFTLPEELIALRPAQPRDASRLMVVGNGRVSGIDHHKFGDLADLLRPGDALVFNDTKVIPARLLGERARGDVFARIEVTLHQRLDAANWLAFAKGAKRLKAGDRIIFGAEGFAADVVDKQDGGQVQLAFNRADAELDAAIAAHGALPLPPYIASKRPNDRRDLDDYQTIYAREAGAVAAPTAGLHFTDEVFAQLKTRGVDCLTVTLHVGAGTFLPVKVDDTADHVMHHENGVIDEATAARINAVRATGGRIISVGTTSLRLLESAADESGHISGWRGATDIFITPGYRFKVIDGLITNFHLPRSTLFMLVCAFAGYDTMRQAYETAIKQGYRFYSYGDSSLLFPPRA